MSDFSFPSGLGRQYTKLQALYLAGPGSLRPIGAHGIYAITEPLPANLEALQSAETWKILNDKRVQDMYKALALVEPVEARKENGILRKKAMRSVRFPLLEYCTGCNRVQRWTASDDGPMTLSRPGKCTYADKVEKHSRRTSTKQLERVWVCEQGHLDEVLESETRRNCEDGCEGTPIRVRETLGETLVFKCDSHPGESHLKLNEEKPCTGRVPYGPKSVSPSACSGTMRLLRIADPELWQARMVTTLYMPATLLVSEEALEMIRSARRLESVNRPGASEGEKLTNLYYELRNKGFHIGESVLGATLEELDKEEVDDIVEAEPKEHELNQLLRLKAGAVDQPFFIGAQAKAFSAASPILAVSAVERLKTTTTLIEASRLGGPPSISILSGLNHRRGAIPLMAFESFGEGILLWVKKEWLAERRGADEGFGALHSFSHTVLRALGEKAGVGLSGLQERLYLDAQNPAILIYMATGDRVGTLGGLSSLGANVSFLEALVEEELLRMQWCSLDPICTEEKGGACHHCLYLPETCCELNGGHGTDTANSWLSRARIL